MSIKNAFYAQSGGVTAVINASACGVIQTAKKHKDKIGTVYAGQNGILGALSENLIDTSKESDEDIANAQQAMSEQGTQIEKNLYTDPDFAKSYEADKKNAAENREDFVEMRDREIVALIAYLQRLGTDIKVKETGETVSK